MSPKSNFARDQSYYRRDGNGKEGGSGKSFLIITEGAKTEPVYLKQIRDMFKLTAADVRVVPGEGTDPANLVNTAIRYRDERARQADKGLAVPYDEVWVVFDLEGPHDPRHRQAHESELREKVEGIRRATSNPCFEFWLLLHHEYTTTQFPDCEAVVKRLNTHLSKAEKYKKGEPVPARVLEKTGQAAQNARQCAKHHSEGGGDGNPSTDIDLLIKSLNDAARPKVREELTLASKQVTKRKK